MRWEGMSGLEAQRAMVTVALGLTVGMQLLTVLINSFSLFFLAKNEDDDLKQKLSIENEQVEPNPPLGLSILAVISYHIEYVLSFMFVRLVEPITYGACDAMRRLAIILTGKKMFGGAKFTLLQIGGIAMSLLGALLYSLVSKL